MAHSVEFFPPKNAAGEERLREAITALLPLGPEYASVTFGAGGSTRERTFATVTMIRQDYDLEAVPHLSCIGST
ncbi:MAG: methylenetetrahydrofolate reductase [NAD(P)H], partial [Acidithiobacillus ferrivorans]